MEQWKKQIFLTAIESRHASELIEQQVSGTPAQSFEALVNTYPKLTDVEKADLLATLKAKYPQI